MFRLALAKLIVRAVERLAVANSSLSKCWFRNPHDLARWDYERELLTSAACTLDVLERGRSRDELRHFRRALSAIRRVAASLPIVRRQIMASDYGATVLHGDVHSGNVVVRVQGGHYEPILIDWARTRLGFPVGGRQFLATASPLLGTGSFAIP